jgi:hypothetical protein
MVIERWDSFSVMNEVKVRLRHTEHPNALPASWRCPGKGSIVTKEPPARIYFTNNGTLRMTTTKQYDNLSRLTQGYYYLLTNSPLEEDLGSHRDNQQLSSGGEGIGCGVDLGMPFGQSRRHGQAATD